MRFLHSADWHLGHVLHGANLIDDQAHLLNQFVELAAQEKPDAVLLAGCSTSSTLIDKEDQR